MAYVITRKALEYRQAEPIGLTLMSDLHIGARNCEQARIKRDLERARENGDRININGDVFDAIIPSDRKRFRQTALDEFLLGRDDILDAAVEMAVSEEYLGPYAKLIDSISIGNHELVVEKIHATDLIARLVRRLNRMGGEVEYAGTIGYVQYLFRLHGKGRAFDIFHYHGRGGDAPITKGMIDFSRLATWVDADVLWIGHKHNKLANTDPMRIRCPLQGDEPVERQQVYVMTGGYLRPVEGQTSKDALINGRKAEYSSDWGLRPQARGGARLLVKIGNRGIENVEAVI